MKNVCDDLVLGIYKLEGTMYRHLWKLGVFHSLTMFDRKRSVTNVFLSLDMVSAGI